MRLVATDVVVEVRDNDVPVSAATATSTVSSSVGGSALSSRSLADGGSNVTPMVARSCGPRSPLLSRPDFSVSRDGVGGQSSAKRCSRPLISTIRRTASEA